MKKSNKFSYMFWFIILLVLALIIWSVYSYFTEGLMYHILKKDTQEIINLINSFGFFSWIVFIVLVVLEVVFAPIPAVTLYLISGLIFGTLLGGILVLIGNIIGASIDFYIARKLGRRFIEKKFSYKEIKKFDNFSQNYGFITLFLLRLNPFTSSDIFSYLSGFTKIRFIKFIFATSLGLAPLIFIQTYLGGLIISISPLLSNILLIITLIFILAIIFMAITWLKKPKRNKRSQKKRKIDKKTS